MIITNYNMTEAEALYTMNRDNPLHHKNCEVLSNMPSCVRIQMFGASEDEYYIRLDFEAAMYSLKEKQRYFYLPSMVPIYDFERHDIKQTGRNGACFQFMIVTKLFKN
jgi:hypothetical protein